MAKEHGATYQYNQRFNLKHAIYSTIAVNNKINNFPGSDYLASTYEGSDNNLKRTNILSNLHKLFDNCINPISNKFDNMIGLNSVYRNKKLNELIGGGPNSQHIYGYAADITPRGNITSAEIFNFCARYLPVYHQLIWEYPERGEYSPARNEFSWVHISYMEGSNFKINSISSKNPKIHNYYKSSTTYSLNNFTHRIKEANPNLISDIDSL